MKHQLPIYIATIAAVAALGAPAILAADAPSGIIVAQATSPADPNHPSSTPGFMPKEESAAAQPAAPAPQRKKSAASTGQQQRHAAQSQQRQRHSAQSTQQQRHAAQSTQRRHEPSTTGSSSSHK